MPFTKFKYDFFVVYSNNQMENIKFYMRDHGKIAVNTFNCDWSIYVLPFTIQYWRKYTPFLRSTENCMLATPAIQKSASSHYLSTFIQESIPLCVK
jgi:hypothetical protein